MNPVRHLKLTVTVLFLIVLSVVNITSADQPVISSFTGETTPGITSQMALEWTYGGTLLIDLQFKLYSGSETGFELISEMDGSRLSYPHFFKKSSEPITYKLEAISGGEVVAEALLTPPPTILNRFRSFTAADVPYDGGGAVEIIWDLSDDGTTFSRISVYRNTRGDDQWNLVATVSPAENTFIDGRLTDGKPYNYLVRAYGVSADQKVICESRPVTDIISHAGWFDLRKINLLVIALIVLSAVIWYIIRAGKKKMYIRKIAGLSAVEEAVGRATEMGRSVLFIPGIQDLDDVQTIAGLNILGSVAKLTAEYETGLNVPVSRSLVMSNGREVVKEAYLSVGRPDFYNDDMVHYVTDEQFGYVAAVDGIMVREKPAACFYMGAFFAESLILAETGNYIGAIQIAGTAMPTQLPFFVAACDFTLIGEELFAASAYLSKDNRMIASLRGQDVGKALAMFAILSGSIMSTVASVSGSSFWMKLSNGFIRLFALNY